MKENRSELLTVGEVAEILGVNKNTILHYDRKGLICSIRSDNNYRYYHKKQINAFREILNLRKIGFSIEKVKTIKKYENSSKYDVILNMVEQKKEEYKKEIENIERNMKVLESYRKHTEYRNKKEESDKVFCIKDCDEERCTVFNIEGREKNWQKFVAGELKKYKYASSCLKKYFFGYIISEKNFLNGKYHYSKFIIKKDMELCPDKYIFMKGKYAQLCIKNETSLKKEISYFLDKIKENGYRTEGDMFIESVSLFDRLTEDEPEIIILKIMVKSLTSE